MKYYEIVIHCELWQYIFICRIFEFWEFFLLYTILASYNVRRFILKQHNYNLYTVNQLLLSQF